MRLFQAESGSSGSSGKDEGRVTPGTSEIKDVVPDSEKNTDPTKSYDDDFEYLTSKPLGSKDSGETAADKPKESEGQSVKPKAEGEQEAPSKGEGEEEGTKPSEPAPQKPADLETRLKQAEERLSATQSAKDKREGELLKQVEELTQQINSLQNFKLAQEELEKEPLAFLYKFFPTIAQTLDPDEHIQAQLRQEFGQDFKFDANEAYEKESPSYKWRRREQELRDKLRHASTEAEFTRRTQSEQREALLNQAKQDVMKSYKLDESTFQKEIVDWSKGQPLDWRAIAKLRFFDDLVAKAVKDAAESAGREKGSPPDKGASNITGGEPLPIPDENKVLQEEFGDMF